MNLHRLARLAALPLLLAALAGCQTTTSGQSPTTSPLRSEPIPPEGSAMGLREGAAPTMRWGTRKGGDAWTQEVLAALESDGVNLIQAVPGDVATYCPGFASADVQERKAFWAGFLSSLAKHESTWNPQAKGGGGKWLGLMQIAPSTWRGYGCTGEILDGGDNLSCAVRIMNKQVGRDGVIAGGGTQGVGRDWAPMRSASKRADIAGWTRKQAYCAG